MKSTVVPVILGLLALVALAYFALIAWRAEEFAGALLHRGWDKRGWTQPRLALRLRLIGIAGVAVAVAAVGLAVFRALG